MPSGACVLRYDGERGAVSYVKFVDATGRQVKERLGREADGWTKRKAEPSSATASPTSTATVAEAAGADVRHLLGDVVSGG